MKLLDYLSQNNLSQKEFAKRSGLSRGTISLLCRGATWLSREAAVKIGKASRGRVSANDFVDGHDYRAGSNRKPTGSVRWTSKVRRPLREGR
jgi:transcriptional regulator with XRE-family HTH domain